MTTTTALRRLALSGALDSDMANTLIEAATLQQTLLQILRIALDRSFDPERSSPGLRYLLARTVGETDFAVLDQRLRAIQSGAHAVFERLLGD